MVANPNVAREWRADFRDPTASIGVRMRVYGRDPTFEGPAGGDWAHAFAWRRPGMYAEKDA